ncbi:hypothetical protein An15g03960 [Aspergillus niger]|uniref:Uncharacterized protein n=2 Tax=Aspergillus niger TaxID=5061 RepID=A5ABZ2_ASPNC|nr:hypothetical protein An15g03960 [Aspergillus niger]CAK97264.1 hypothetical protein An15g03960 [Aspergillus niger]
MTYPPCPPIHNSRSKHMKKPGFGGSSSTCVVCDSHKRGGRKRAKQTVIFGTCGRGMRTRWMVAVGDEGDWGGPCSGHARVGLVRSVLVGYTNDSWDGRFIQLLGMAMSLCTAWNKRQVSRQVMLSSALGSEPLSMKE